MLKKNYLIVVGILVVVVAGGFYYFNKNVQGKFQFYDDKVKSYDERIFAVESRSAGLSEALKQIIAKNLEEVFVKSAVFSGNSCAYIRNNFKSINDTISVASSFKAWHDETSGLYNTDNEFFNFGFEALKYKYSNSKAKLAAITRVQQCLLNNSAQ